VSPSDNETVRNEDEQALDTLTDFVIGRGLGTPTAVMLEALRPLNFIGSQCMHGLTPLVSIFTDSMTWEHLARALEERSSIDRLIEKIEKREKEQSQSKS